MGTLTLKVAKIKGWGRSQRSRRRKEEGRTHTAVKDRNESYYTEAIRASKQHNLMNCHQRANGRGVHMPVGDIPKVEGREGCLR